MDITIAILPFKHLSKEDHILLLMAGFRDDLVINLSKFSGLSVLAPQSTEHIQSANDTDEITKLGIDYLLNGSVRSWNDQVRIGIQLTRTTDAKIIFASDYVESLEVLFNIQDDIVKQVVNALQQYIDHDLLTFSHKKKPIQLAAYENYLLGMNALKKGSSKFDHEARQYFEAALAIDSQYARAYTGLSLSYFNEWSCQLWDRWDVSKKGALDYALKALEVDEYDYVSLGVAGRAFLFSEEYEKAEHYLRKSVQINPNDANNLVQVAFSMIYLGLAAEAEQLYLKACTLNPIHADTYFGYGSAIYFELGDYEKALELGKKLDPNSVWVDFPAYLAASYFYLSDLDKMQVEWNLYLSLFAENISKTKAIDEQAALEWQINVNPYKQESKMKAFLDYITEQQGLTPVASKEAMPYTKASFTKKGDLWEVVFAGETTLLKDAKGYRDIAMLLQFANQEVHCSELMGRVVVEAQGIAVLDQRAKRDYQQKILTLQSEITEAEEFGHTQRLVELQQEYDQLVDHLSSSLGLAGKSRLSSTGVDKVRSAVTLRIRGSIKKIEKLNLRLAKHLQASIKTGTFCTYQPETPVEWEL